MKRLLIALGIIGPFTPPLPAHAQACAPVPSGLVAWWRVEGNAFDAVGTNDGVLLGGTTFIAGAVGQSLSFNGLDGRVEVPRNPSLFGLTQGTLEMWVKVADLAVDPARLFSIAKAGVAFPNSDQWSLDYRS